jgi:hypothetical protein
MHIRIGAQRYLFPMVYRDAQEPLLFLGACMGAQAEAIHTAVR